MTNVVDQPRLFGTDGVRGVAGRYPLDGKTLWKLGRALAQVLAPRGGSLHVLLGEDTRESSPALSRAIAAGLRSAGATVDYAGVLTTPGIAFLTQHLGFGAGVVVSASHNPYDHNGVKILSASGLKLAEDLEVAIERALVAAPAPPSGATAELVADPSFREEYLAFLEKLALGVSGGRRFRIVADCAHGAASHLAPELLRRLGIPAQILNAEPTGRNINVNSGSLHPETMAAAVRASWADLGVALDGDADRAIFSTAEGRVADGDHVLYAAAPFLRARGRLPGDAVVGTLMTNLALELAFARQGIALKRTPVGDKHVLDRMLRSGLNLGGEPSGHIIFADVSLAGDGLVTLIEVLRFVAESGQPLGELVRDYRPFPQLIHNVAVRAKPPLDTLPEVARQIEACRSELGSQGRVVVRYSGTEPLARVMVEGERAEVVQRWTAAIASAIEGAAGAAAAPVRNPES